MTRAAPIGAMLLALGGGIGLDRITDTPDRPPAHGEASEADGERPGSLRSWFGRFTASGALRRLLGAEDATLTASGTIEARNIEVGSKVGGRVTQVLVQEGEAVQAGQLLVVFDDAELRARAVQARGRLDQARAVLAKMERGSRPEDIAEMEAAALSSDARRGFRTEETLAARAELERARAELVNAERADRRAGELAAKGAVSTQFRDDAEARLLAARAQVRAAEHGVAAAEGRWRAAQAAFERAERGSRQEDIDAAGAEVMRAEGELQEAQARLAEHEVRAPAAAVVEVLDLRPGDLVQPNAIAARLLEADQLFVIVYVPETRIARVRLRQRAEVRVDGYHDRVFTARVEQIRQHSEFLPRNVQTEAERVHQVIGVKLRVDDPRRELRAGISATVTFVEEAGS